MLTKSQKWSGASAEGAHTRPPITGVRQAHTYQYPRVTPVERANAKRNTGKYHTR